MNAIIIGGEPHLIGVQVEAIFFSHAEKGDGTMSVLYDTNPPFFRVGSEHLGGIKFYHEHLMFIDPSPEVEEEQPFTLFDHAV